MKQEPLYVIADLGNSLWKYIFMLPRAHELVIPHAIVRDESGLQYRNTLSRHKHRGGVGDTSIFKVDDVGYIVGESAESMGVISRLDGASKYTRDYIGVSLMAGLLQVLPVGHNNICLFVSYPPGDVEAVGYLAEALGGKWEIQTSGGETVKYVVREVQPYDEPLGVYTHVIAGPDGIPYKDHALKGGNKLIVDVGGQISSVMRVTASGKVQYNSARSIPMGILNVMDNFWQLIRSEYPELMNLKTYNAAILREALRTGSYEYKGKPLQRSGKTPVEELARRATLPVINRLSDFYMTYFESGANDSHILIGGGGGAAMYPYLQEIFQHNHMMRAEPHLDQMHLACVRGGQKMAIADLRGGRK
jgi:hypothetical protein